MTAKRIIVAAAIALALLAGGMMVYRHMKNSAPQLAETPPTPERPPSAPPVPLTPPKLWRLANDVECLKAEALRFEGATVADYGAWKPIGVLLTNTCETPQVLSDIKHSLTALEYVSSRLPAKIALLGADAAAPVQIVTLSRGGEHCETMTALPDKCRLLPIAPKQRAFVALPDQSWFSLKLQDEKKITGFSGLPQDPALPKPVPKMPDMGFKLKGVGAP